METLAEFEQLTKHFTQEPEIAYRSEQERQIAEELLTAFETLENWNKDEILLVFRSVMETYHIRMPILYYVLTGAEKGLPLPESIEILGKEKVLGRLQKIV
jgi:glutamyl/glutaminyl-tRNA synthetase